MEKSFGLMYGTLVPANGPEVKELSVPPWVACLGEIPGARGRIGLVMKSSALKKMLAAVPEKSMTLNGWPLWATVTPWIPQPLATPFINRDAFSTVGSR